MYGIKISGPYPWVIDENFISSRSEKCDRSLAVIYLDLNSFFASVEQELEPKLRKKPVAVVPMLANSATILAASYEAKAFGIKTGTLVAQAKRLCPSTQFVLADHKRYVEYHHKIHQELENILPVDKVCSIDEFSFKLMGQEKSVRTALNFASKVKKCLYEKVGTEILGSVGLAPNRYLAKIAADMNKPNGVSVLLKADLPKALFALKLRDLPGIGPQTEKKLLREGVGSIQKLLELSPNDAQRAWGGIWGRRVWHWVQALEADSVETKRHSISHSHVLAPEFRSFTSAFLIAQKLLHKAASRLRREGFRAKRLSVHISFVDDLDHFDQAVGIPELNDDISLLEEFKKLWQQAPQTFAPKKIAISLHDLCTSDEATIPLFFDPKRENFVQALDKINDKFGKSSLYFASQHNLKGVASPKIAFTNIPDIEADGDGFEPKN